MATIQSLPANWESVYVFNRVAENVPPYAQVERYYPIPQWESITLLDSPVVVLYAESDSAQPHWKYAGQAIQRIRTGLTVGGNPDTVNSVKKFFLNQASLLWFPFPTPEYSLAFSIPHWIRDIRITGWVYTGTITETYDNILSQILEGVTP